MTPTPFAELIERARRGEGPAVQQLFDSYGPVVAREIRFSVFDDRLRRFISESDVCQSVFLRFCLELWAGNYELASPQQLITLLKLMARSRIVDWNRYAKAKRRDIRRDVPIDSAATVLFVRDQDTPSQIIATAELLERVRGRMTDAELQVLEWRQNRVPWQEIANRMGNTTAEAVRKEHERAVRRAAESLGISTY